MSGPRPHPLTSASPSAADLPLRRSKRRIAYLADPGAVTGAATLFHQKRVIDVYAGGCGMPLDGYVVDSGTALSAAGIACGLNALLRAARQGEVDAIVVEHISRLAVDYAVALRIAAALTAWGADVHEARGGAVRLEPDLAARLAVNGPRAGLGPIAFRRQRTAGIPSLGALRRVAPERVP